MLEELNRRLDVIEGYVEGIHERTEQSMPEMTPPYPNRLMRRQQIERQINQSIFSPNLHELYKSVPKNYAGPEFIKQLLEAENNQSRKTKNKKSFDIDYQEYITILAQRNSNSAPYKI
ncbi:hypothetical protein GPJ56_003246 [Histomonas meleagridis]|uniref:uncharacterized protein n=1 Tax=Histomonas meleagridis TaxID=135588 RepID=UPI003559BD0A|nr:hypothetical protein GPJ56_003246 [Histomonas meleagridis]KAH0802412.1 hypothetical protein GO595_004790 [Histomonas meleagridis]